MYSVYKNLLTRFWLWWHQMEIEMDYINKYKNCINFKIDPDQLNIK